MSLDVPPPNHKLGTAKITYFVWKGAQPRWAKKFLPGIGYVLCLLPVKGIVVLVDGPIIDLQIEAGSTFLEAESIAGRAAFDCTISSKLDLNASARTLR